MVIQSVPAEVIRRMYTQGYLTSTEMCQLALAIKNKMLQREFCKRKRNNRNRNGNRNASVKRKAPMRAKRPWLK